MAYPRLPGDGKQYPDTWFPAIPTREIPKDDSVSQIDEAPVAIHGSGSDKTSDSLGPPKKMAMGALRVWVEGAGRASRAYDDGPDFDYGKAGIKKPTAAGEETFNLAPGTDEKAVTIRWEVYGLPNIKSAKLELFAKDIFKPIWEHHWGNAWGKKKAEISDFVSKTGEKDKVSARGSLPFSTVAVDTAAQAKGPTGVSAAAFPKGKLTVARSPYQLRLTVSGCTAQGAPADGDKLVYPMTAWTHLHVLLAGFDYKFGDKAWLKARDDVQGEAKELLAGKSGQKGLEELIIENLKGFVTGKDSGVQKMTKDTVHRIPLTAEHNKGWGDDDHTLYKDLWGKGPRIPLVATATIQKLDGKPTADHAADVMNGAGVVWDWEEADPRAIDTRIAATPTVGGGSRSAELLKKVLKEPSESHWPTGSFNCPKAHGGKHGDDALLHWDAGPDKYKHTPLGKRKSAVLTVFDDTGESGTVFWPSRFPGDQYRVKTYLHDPDLDKKEVIADPPVPVGSPGVFQVYRKVTVHHLVIGTLPGSDAGKMRDDVKAEAAKQVNLHVDFVVADLGNHDDFMKEVRKNLIKNSTTPGEFHFHALEFPHFLDLSKGDAMFKVPSFDAYQAAIEDRFKRGAIRMIKPVDFGAEYGKSGTAVGGGTKGCIVDFGTEKADKTKVQYAISEAGQPAFTNGATVNDPFTEKSYTITYDTDLKSCWEVKFEPPDETRTDKAIAVTIGTQPEIKLDFRPQGVKRNVATELSGDMKNRLKGSFDAAVNALADGETLTVKIHSSSEKDSGNAKLRRDNVKAELELLVATRVIQRRKVLEEFQTQDPTSTFYTNTKTSFGSKLFEAAKGLFGQLASTITFTYAKQKDIKEGLILVHAGRLSSFTDHPDAKGTNKGGDFVDYAQGAYFSKGESSKVGFNDPAYKKVSMIYLVTPNPGAPTTLKRATKKPWAIMLHEMGHGFWLNHAPLSRSGQPPTPSPVASEHVAGEACLMSYDADSDLMCAICMLRLRGWDWSAWKDNTTPDRVQRKVAIKLGDPNTIFPTFARTVEGKRERLQVLGLFLRPLGLEFDSHPEFVTEFKEAWDYAWKLAKTLLPGVDTNPDGVLGAKIKEFIIDGGELPAQDSETRIRVFGHYHPYYSNMDVAIRYGNAQKKDSRENQFKMNAKIGDVQGMVLGGNVAIGTLPLEITVTDDAGTPLPHTDVWVRLMPPKPATKKWNDGFAGKKVLGATSFVDGTQPPAFTTPEHKHIEKWLNAKIKPHKPAPDSDPQKDNVHFDMGGKRAMQPAGDCVTPVDGIPNVFVGGNIPIDEFGSPVRHGIQLTTNSSGVAFCAFKPSVIGGDTYRLEVLVREGAGKEARTVGRCETGNMVVWRTLRIAGYYQRQNVPIPTQLAPPLVPHTRRYSDLETLFRPLSGFDLKKSVGLELARSFIEALFEDDALAPKPLPDDYETNADRAAATYANKPVELYSMLASGNGGPRVRLDQTGPRTFEGTIPVKVRPWHVAVAPVGMHDLSNNVATAIAHIDPDSADTDAKVKLVVPPKGKYIYSFDEELALEAYVLQNSRASYEYVTLVGDGKGMSDKIKVDAGSEFEYATGKVKVVLAADVPPPKPAKVLNAKVEHMGANYVVTGATTANTDDGVLYVRTSTAPKGTWDVCFYKDTRMRPSDLVCAARRVKAGKTKATARPEKDSGLTIKFDVGSEPVDGNAARLTTGIFILNAIYVPEKVIDRNAVLVRGVKHSPWLMNFSTPDGYNERKGAGFPPAPPARFFDSTSWWDEGVGEKREFAFCETVLLRSYVAAVRNQGICYYPGQFYVQSNYMNPIQGGGLKGKGVGNVAFLFTQGITSEKTLHYLVLHETGHCLYGIHAPDEDGNIKDFHDDDLAYRCIMAGPGNLESSKPDAQKNLGTFCGKCNAGLRGIHVMEPPLFAGTKAMPVGESRTARKPKVLSPTGGLTVPDPGDVDPHPTPKPTTPPTDVVVVVVDKPAVLSDDDIVCDIKFLPQKKSLWCWAAASQIMRKFYKKEEIEQEDLAREARGNEDDKEYALPLVGLDFDSSGEGSALSFDAIKKEIDDDKPFIFGNSQHYMICYGYRDDADQTVHVWDPLPVNAGQKKTMKYTEYKAAIETGESGRRGANYSNIRVKKG